MATKADFSEEEWDALQRGVTGSGMLVSLSDRDFTDSFGEAKALAKELAEERGSSTSPLVRDLAGVHSSGFGLGASPQKLETETLDALRSSVATLGAKAPDELDAYRGLVIAVAERVAEAKGGGTSDVEAQAIAKIKEAVGAPSS